MDSKNKKLIVVLGMHRSGTSVIARGLQVLSVGLGDNLMPPMPGVNDKGFYEDLDIIALNEEILHFLSKQWFSLAPLDVNYVDCLRQKGYFARAVELIQRKIKRAFVFGLKEPRIARLLAFWKEVFYACQVDVHYILAIRHPMSVAHSVSCRANLGLEHGYLLWLCYVYESLKHSIGFKSIFVDYDRLMCYPDKELERIGQAIAEDIDPNEMRDYKETFLEQQLRHTVYNLEALQDNICPKVVREMYTDLLALATDKTPINDAELENKMIRWAKEMEHHRFSLMIIDKLISRERDALIAMGEYRNQATELEKQVTNLTHQLAECEAQTASLTHQLTERDAQLMGLNQTLSKLLNSKSWIITKPLRLVCHQFGWSNK